MTREKYFNICEQMNEEPNPDRMPPELEDFPSDVQKAVIVFNKLGDKVYPDIGYTGKDYTALPIYIESEGVECKDMFLETILRLDNFVITESAEKRQRELKALSKTPPGVGR